MSVVSGCLNEVGNVEELCRQVAAAVDSLPPRDGEPYTHEHIIIDNASTDGTVDVLRRICERDPRVRVIVNTRNFGHIRSPYHALLQARGDAVIGLASDLQDPPEMIRDFVREWEAGYKVVVGVRQESLEKRALLFVRGAFYRIIDRLSEVQLVRNFTGFGLYDRIVIDKLREIDDPYPYFRGLVCDLGYARAELPYSQARRRSGITKNNFYTLYDLAMLGITNHSKVPLRLATMAGFALSMVALLIAAVYLVLKLSFWSTFSLGLAPLVIGVYFFGSVQLFFIGILGEYIGSIHTHVHHRPLVIEKERINFD
ncbi:glycosyltransferase family 2 protein [Mycobacterium seoulense]|uniref:glycosyltransferase family 2 protein n=1 Tax=Mycobacterium seoulense TaxID=386911 RepID=UPI003CF13E52